MGGLDHLPPRPGAQAVAPLLPHEMQHIRKVYDEDVGGKKFASIISPREDSQMFRNVERHKTPCECIVELYELLWRWGHRNPPGQGFAENFGFAIPDTIVIVKGKPYAWYFISKKDGSLLRKSEASLDFKVVLQKLGKDLPVGVKDNMPCAVWMPMASQFEEARCYSPYAEFLSSKGLTNFVMELTNKSSGIIQRFEEPHGVSNFLVRTVEFRRQTSLCMRTNRSLLASGGSIFDRCATYEGWDGLSSSASRYRSHKHPHMEELILAASETLNRRIEQERVRQMLFLGPHQHVALHFKVTQDNSLSFIFASIVSEKDVILQTRPKLLMGDPCMTEELPGQALLPGGTYRKAQPYEAPACYPARGAELLEGEEFKNASNREGSLPPIETARGATQDTPRAPKRRALSARRPKAGDGTLLPNGSLLPKVAMPPEVPRVPYQTLDLPRHVEDYTVHAAQKVQNDCLTDAVKRPLITTARSEPATTQRYPTNPDN